MELTDPGYELGCFIGLHAYTNGTCAWCDRKDHNTVEYKPATD